MWWVVAGVLAAGTVAQAAPWIGFAQLADAPGRGVRLRARLDGATRQVRGRITTCTGDGPCPFADARVRLDVGAVVPGESVRALSGSVTLADGSTCTFEGDVWRVEVRGRRVPRGALHGQATCPTVGRATLTLWVKGYRVPPGSA
jgi:hypothetical protein